MTKYREILRLTALGLSQRNIVQSIGVSQKTVVKVQKRAWEMHLSWPLDESLTDSALETLMFHKESKVSKQKRMPDFNYIQKELHRNGVNSQISTTSRRSCSATVSTRNSSGRSTWRNAASPATSHSCIPSSVIISSRMSRNAAQPCISTESPENRSKLTGQEILHRSLIRIPARSSPHFSLWVS